MTITSSVKYFTGAIMEMLWSTISFVSYVLWWPIPWIVEGVNTVIDVIDSLVGLIRGKCTLLEVGLS